jgi:UDP-2,3-diacylglucosamine pyrophosphatase LpxH
MRLTIAASDTHIWNDSHQAEINALCDYVEAQKPALLVLVGDIADPWQSKWQDILKTKSWDRLSKLCDARKKAALETIYIRGNHDSAARAKHLQGASLRRKHREDTFLFVHGWEWDPVWGGLLGRAFFWISLNASFLMMPMYNIFWGRKGHTPGSMKSQGYRDEWDAKKGMIHLKAEEYAKKKGLTVILGHTHCPAMTPLMADAGDWVDSFSIVEISQDGKYTMKHLVNGTMTAMS